MRLVPTLTWNLESDGAEPLHERLLPLLEAIDASASLAAAVRACGISYRAGWGLLREYQAKLGTPLVRLERGRGASLAPAGEQLLAARRAAARQLGPLLRGLETELQPRSAAAREPPALRVRVAASHDLALAALSEALPVDAALTLDLSFVGSLRALEEFAEGRAEVAGFHVPVSGPARADTRPFLRWLRDRRDRLVRFVDRDQGLILPHGNPAHVRGFRDVVAKRLRFVNRQRGSGTRLLIDAIIGDAGIDARDVDGYRTEEFTHAAVAATVASGGADAAFGLRAAAAEYRLAFVPLVRERYFLAVRHAQLESPAVARLIAALHDGALARVVRPLAGYDTADAGSVMRVGSLRV